MTPRLRTYFQKKSSVVDRALQRWLPKRSASPRRLHEAMRYSIFSGGKHLRPILTIAAAEICGGTANQVLPTACALELIHTYSLIHDDLPAMDDDDLRRGRPTNHKVYGEALAILVGDALLTHAFQLVAQNASQPNISPRAIRDVLRILTTGAGTLGMIGGQAADIASDQGRWKKSSQRFEGLTPQTLLSYIHSKKTSALIVASLLVGARLVNASPKRTTALKRYGQALGLAFQVKDDILDVIGDKKKLGKKGSDRSNQKLTYPSLYGLEKSQHILNELISTAHQALAVFGPHAAVLHDLADFVRDRDH